jgi:hypothetical protein
MNKKIYHMSYEEKAKKFALWWWLYNRAKWSKSSIARIFRTDHATVINGINKASAGEILLLDMAGSADKILEILNRARPGETE